MIRVTCDNRLRLSSLPSDVADDLRFRLTFNNPQHAKLVAMGMRYNSEPPIISVWNTEYGQLTIPRGAMNVLRDVLSKHGLDYEVDDQRTLGDASITGSYEDPWGLQDGVQFP